jgi:hypothetical protein
MVHKINSVCARSGGTFRLSSQRASLLVFSVITVLGLLYMPVLGCTKGTETIKTPASISTGTTKIDTGNKYTIKVFSNDEQIASLSLDDVLKLQQVAETADGKEQEGPTLLSVLELAGVREFSEVKVEGLTKGRIASAELILSKGQITDRVILDRTNKGTTKLCSPDIAANNWIIDVDKLVVK